MLKMRWSLYLSVSAIVLVMSSGLRAQEAPAATDTPKADTKPEAPEATETPARPPSPFEDPKFQLMALRSMVTGQGNVMGGGGRGGRGGGSSQGMTLSSMVLRYPALQEEVELTPEQKTELQKISDETRQKARDTFTNMREDREKAQQLGQEQGNGRMDFSQMGETMRKFGEEQATAIDKVLTAEQQKRLQEIALQIEGPTAIARPEVMSKINMSPAAQQQINLIVQQMKTMMDQSSQARMEKMRARFMAARNANNNQPQRVGAPQQRGAPAAKAADTQAKAEAPADNQRGGRGGFDREAMMKEISDGVEEQIKILQMAEKAIGRQLSAKQKQTFNDMLGEPFDLKKLAQGGGMFGGGGRPGGGGPPGGGRGGRGGN